MIGLSWIISHRLTQISTESRRFLLCFFCEILWLRSMFEGIAKSRLRMIWFSLLTVIGISLVIMLFVVRFVNRPIRGPVATMSKVESGDLTAEARIANSGELGKLGKSLNSMTAKLREDINRLEVLQETAEKLRRTMDPEEAERITVRGIVRGMGFERVALLLVNQEEQMLEGKIGIGITKSVLKNVRIPLDREYGILAETMLDAKPFNVQGGVLTHFW